VKRLLLLVLALMLAVGLWSAAYGKDNGNTGKTISGPVEQSSKVALPNIADRSVDFDGNGSIDYQILTRHLVTKYTGIMNGYGTVLLTATDDLNTKMARAFAHGTFWGTVGDSEPGAMTFFGSLVTDKSNPVWVISARYTVVEGSGSGGLEGITGYGISNLTGPGGGPYSGDANWWLRFSNASGTAFLASP
jgi:hypothetical protein